MKPLFQRILLLGGLLLTATACDRAREPSASETAAAPVANTNNLSCHALVIGISDYARTGWPELGTARADADAVGDVLEQKYGFQVTRLIDREATRRNMLQALDTLMDFGPNDAVLVYYAGHGFYDSQMDEGYWIPYGAAQSHMEQPAKEDWLWNTTISRIISASPARHILLIADTCYGGSLFRGEDTASKTDRWYQRAISVPSRYLITSGNLEPVLDSGIRHSIFAQEIINYLKYNEQDVFSASDLGIAIRKKVSSLTGQLVRMGPLSMPAHAGGEFVFIRPEAGSIPLQQNEQVAQAPRYRTASLQPEPLKPQGRLEQLMEQIEKYSAQSTDSTFVRPRILACMGPTGSDSEEAARVRNRLRDSLIAQGGCILVEREAFDEVLEEMTLGQSSLADSRVTTQIGKMLPASLILFGEIIPAGDQKEIHLRVVDTETSRVLTSAFLPFNEQTLSSTCRDLAAQVMAAINRARPLLLPATQTATDTLRIPWGRFHGAQVGEQFDILQREALDSIAPRERDLGTATLLSATEESAMLKAEWNTTATNRPAEVWLRAQLPQSDDR